MRRLLFEHATALNLRIRERFDHAAGHLTKEKATGVLGAIDGADQDINTMRVLMIFARDYLPPATTKEDE